MFFEVTKTACIFAKFLKNYLSAYEQNTKGIVYYQDFDAL